MEEQNKNEVTNQNESYFDGTMLQHLGWSLAGTFVTIFTLGFGLPIAVCWLCSWEANHTIIDGKRLKFTGKAGGLFGTWIKCILLTIVTLGIYGFYIPIKLRKWKKSKIFFEDEATTQEKINNLTQAKVSYFDGGFWQLFGKTILGAIITIFTLGICYPVAVNMINKWETKHTVYNNNRCHFDGTALQLFGTWIKWFLLSIVTLGIYALWLPVKLLKWTAKHTHFKSEEFANDKLVKKIQLSEKAKKRIRLASIISIATIILAVGSVFAVQKINDAIQESRIAKQEQELKLKIQERQLKEQQEHDKLNAELADRRAELVKEYMQNRDSGDTDTVSAKSNGYGLKVGQILSCNDNLRLRSSDSTSASIVTSMKKGTRVEILDFGRVDTSEGVTSTWTLVKIMAGSVDRDGNSIPTGTTGWCFGGFLE